jgi:hypothetical protein
MQPGNEFFNDLPKTIILHKVYLNCYKNQIHV